MAPISPAVRKDTGLVSVEVRVAATAKTRDSGADFAKIPHI